MMEKLGTVCLILSLKAGKVASRNPVHFREIPQRFATNRDLVTFPLGFSPLMESGNLARR
jgi:hypothetical protein